MHTPLFPIIPSHPFFLFLSYPPSLAPLLPCIPSLLSPPSLAPLLPSLPPSLVPLLHSLPSLLCSPPSLHSLPSLRCVYAFLHASMWMLWMLVCACLSCDVGQGQSDLPVVPGGNSRKLLANMTAHTYSVLLHPSFFTGKKTLVP